MKEGKEFEIQVKRIARQLWGDVLGGAEKILGREYDGVFETKDNINIIECTISKSKSKAKNDLDKLKKAILEYRKNKDILQTVRGFLITKDEPTDDQRNLAKEYKKYNIEILGYEQFLAQLFNGYEYLELRNNYRFGSIYDYKNNSTKVDEREFVYPELYEIKREEIIDWNSLIKGNSKIKCIIGEYGSGKSFALYNVYKEISKHYFVKKNHICPIYLNLRDHMGQDDPAEALIRHAAKIGFSRRDDLIRAWRAGFVSLILDGFDELSALSWAGKLQDLRAFRYASMTLIRRFIEESPAQMNIFISGRSNYFDNDNELVEALGLKNKEYMILKINDFSDDKLREYMKKMNVNYRYPDWLSTKPLLVSYVVKKSLIKDISSEASPYTGWNSLLDIISDREASQNPILDKYTIRKIIERLATYARKTLGSLGDFDHNDLVKVFEEVTGNPPDINSMPFLLRLPGLGTNFEQSEVNGGRKFVDNYLAHAALAFDFIDYIEKLYSHYPIKLEDILEPLQGVSVDIIKEYISNQQSKKQILSCLQDLIDKYGYENQLLCDYVVCLISAGIKLENKKEEVGTINIFSSEIDKIEFDNTNSNDYSFIIFSDCVIRNLIITTGFDKNNLPHFHKCIIQTYIGPDISYGILKDKLKELDIEVSKIKFERNRDILSNADINASVAVLLTILKKLFFQSGAARQENAFYRGALSQTQKAMVPEILRLIKRYDFATNDFTDNPRLWKPNTSKMGEVRKIIANPVVGTHPLIDDVINL